MTSPRQILVTSALPYANGSIHLGHLLEYIQTDIWVRFQKLQGHTCTYVCADDAHGSAIMLRAESEGVTPEALIAQVHAEHSADFADFNIGFDHFHSTHSAENRTLVSSIFAQLQAQGHIKTRSVTQHFDLEKQMFLADRFIKGSCPKCSAPDQYGDNCEHCGATYAATALNNPRSTISGTVPVLRDSVHFFFALPHFEHMLKQWTRSGTLQEAVANKIAEWLEAGLHEWDISRDAPYFGFEIPNAPGKYFYVWLDAPIGYMASFQSLCAQQPGLDFMHYWQPNSTTELHHFIGKDIVNFHTLFWPALLEGAGYRKPTAVHVHGYLTVNGQKMSKSRGTFIKARTYLDHLNPEYLRYYYASKLNRSVDDLDLNLEDFVQKVNADLVGKLVNIASRCAGFIAQGNQGVLIEACPDPALWEHFQESIPQITQAYEQLDFARAMREIMALADRANAWIAEQAPWALNKQPEHAHKVQEVCAIAINLFRQLIILLKPVVPQLAANAEQFLNVAPLTWADLGKPLANHQLNSFQALLTRIDPKKIATMLETAQEDLTTTRPTTPTIQPTQPPLAAEIDFAAFAAVDLRIARIEEASIVEGADKLLRLTLDIGDAKRTVLSGIRAAYPDLGLLEGRLTLYVANLAERRMKFGISQGMILAAGPGGKEIYLLSPDSGAQPGQRVQ